jgi:hypothetical protein
VSQAFYCKYCGTSASSVSRLTAAPCMRHPSGAHKGSHALYEGSEKSEYICKYCGTSASSVSRLTAAPCMRHPSGAHKGPHEPAL